ncbi:Ig-like domain-containing protein [Burkholderiaceae bacterium FT117]|uniref:Kelch repeat-containing protein n=1 Tax=Zeimonas sediminis TaxID=2944268 RepID=UPI002342F41F|nr:Ig-like domain-containing protein [Zeimonas sediminis]MCM5570437.1 Ig-like domain-containing protein [Zeimonas sediminis]
MIDDPDKVGAGWVTIEVPTPPAYSTDSPGVFLSGEAFISPTWSRCCSGSATDTGVTVTWSNAATGESGQATQRVSYVWLFGTAILGTHTWWEGIDLALGDNPITVTATDPSGNLGRARITVTRTPDTVAPTITSTTPANGATGVAVNGSLLVVFSEPMNPATMTPSNILLQDESGGAVAGTVSYADRVATYTPGSLLETSKRHTVTVTTGVRDESGNSLAAPYTWSFTTGTLDLVPPTVASTSPANGETCVPTEAPVSARFSETLYRESVNESSFLLKDATNQLVSGSVGVDYTGTLYLFPRNPLANAATYTATLTTGIEDLARNPLATEYSWSFTTQPAGSGMWGTTSTTGAPTPRTGHTAVWTGSRMIVWGGGYADGASYEPASDAWSPISGAAAPESRTDHVAVWTGSRMIVWGGVRPGAYLDSGALYDPTSDTWSPMSASGAPSPRSSATAVWTGAEMIVWGGYGSGGVPQGDGARYDPSTNTWSPISAAGSPSPRVFHTAVWTGSEMIVWGGGNTSGSLGDGARYDPAADAWSPIPASGAPSPRAAHSAVWTGKEMLVWGGRNATDPLRSGGRFSPASGSWAPIGELCAPLARYGHVSVWTGTEMLVWGGGQANGPHYSAGGRYLPGTDTWQAIPVIGAPAPRMGHTAVWDGGGMILWGGYDVFLTNLDSGGRYQPQ